MNNDESQVETLPDGSKLIVVSMRSLVRGFGRRTMLVLAVYALFSAIQIGFHWYIGTQNTPTAHCLREWYFKQDSLNHKFYNRGYTVWVRPCAILGLATGIILSRSLLWVAELVVWALLLSYGIAALYPLYGTFFPGDEFYKQGVGLTFLFGTMQVGFPIAVARIITAHLIERMAQRNQSGNTPARS